MNITLVLFCLVLISIVQATMYAKISKPRLKVVHSRNSKILETYKWKLPEERRKLSLFPKSSKKFVVSSVLHNKLEPTPKPFILITKKPLMRKIVLQNKITDKRKMALEQEPKRPLMEIKLLNENNLAMFQKAEPYLISEEISIDIIEEKKSDESYEMGNDNFDEKDKIQKNAKEQERAASYITSYKDPAKVKDFTSTPNVKPATVGSEKKGGEPSFNTSGTSVTNNSDEDEIVDLTEFIFVNSLKNTTESDRVSSEESEEFVTTETTKELKLARMERSINVIEEENLGSTVSGYKYTWRDTKLNNDLVFKNINA